MAISPRDIKLLWGRSGSRCAICRVELTQNSESVNAAFALGEQAHIVGEQEDGPRGKSKLTVLERNSYHNLVLLCPNHHTAIDKNEDDWPVERLHQKKSEHELWVSEMLSAKIDRAALAKQTTVMGIIEAAVDLCDLGAWKGWTSFALAADPTWRVEMPDKIFEFRQRVIAAIWPDDIDDLKRAAITFSILVNRASQIFMEHSERSGDFYIPHKFYKADDWNENYDRDVELYEEWLKSCRLAIYNATKAANWFADEIRNTVDPTFFAATGKFLIMEGDFIFGCTAYLLEYSKEEKATLPGALS